MTRNIATLRITPEVLSLIAEIDEFKRGLAGNRPDRVGATIRSAPRRHDR